MCFGRVKTGGASTARLGGGGPECTASGVPRETYGSWDRDFPPRSPPPRAPLSFSPRFCSPSGTHSARPARREGGQHRAHQAMPAGRPGAEARSLDPAGRGPAQHQHQHQHHQPEQQRKQAANQQPRTPRRLCLTTPRSPPEVRVLPRQPMVVAAVPSPLGGAEDLGALVRGAYAVREAPPSAPSPPHPPRPAPPRGPRPLPPRAPGAAKPARALDARSFRRRRTREVDRAAAPPEGERRTVDQRRMRHATEPNAPTRPEREIATRGPGDALTPKPQPPGPRRSRRASCSSWRRWRGGATRRRKRRRRRRRRRGSRGPARARRPRRTGTRTRSPPRRGWRPRR